MSACTFQPQEHSYIPRCLRLEAFTFPQAWQVAGGVLLIHVCTHRDPGQLPLVAEHVDKLPVRPGVQALAQLLAVVNVLPDTGQISDSNLLHPTLHTFPYEVGGGHVKEMLRFFHIYFPFS